METSTLPSSAAGNHIASMDSERLGIIESEFPAVDLPDCNVWTYLHPFFKKWSLLTGLVSGETSTSYTYGQMYELSLRFAKELQLHFQNENPPVVSVICPNIVEYPILYLGCLAVGAPLCPIRHDYGQDLILYMLKETKTTVVVVYPSVLEKCRNVLAKLDREVKVYVAGPGQINPGEKNVFEVLFSNAEMLDVEMAKQVDPESTAMITYSSGTTGNPKGIMRTQKSKVHGATISTSPSFFPVKTAEESFQDTVMVFLPLAHAYGLGFSVVHAIPSGCRIIICDPFDSCSSILNIMEKYKPAVLKVNPYIIDKLSLLTNFGTAFEKMRSVVNVGSPHNQVSFKMLNEKTTKRLVLQESYGASEMGVSIYTPNGDHGQHPGATGKLLPNARVRFVDLATEQPILEPHKPGELFFQLPTFMKGYLDKPEVTKEVLLDGPGGKWFRTGDVGYFDEDRFIYIIERFKDVIKMEEKTVYPSKIETILKEHSSVLDAGVIGSPNTKTGTEEPKAFVIRNGPVEESDLIKFVEENAPPEMWLRGGIDFVDSLPRNPLGKMVRKHLRTMAWVDSHATEKTKNF